MLRRAEDGQAAWQDISALFGSPRQTMLFWYWVYGASGIMEPVPTNTWPSVTAGPL